MSWGAIMMDVEGSHSAISSEKEAFSALLFQRFCLLNLEMI